MVRCIAACRVRTAGGASAVLGRWAWPHGKMLNQRMIDTRRRKWRHARRLDWEGDLISRAANRSGNHGDAVRGTTRAALMSPGRRNPRVTPKLYAMFLEVPLAAMLGLTLDNGKGLPGAKNQPAAGLNVMLCATVSLTRAWLNENIKQDDS